MIRSDERITIAFDKYERIVKQCLAYSCFLFRHDVVIRASTWVYIFGAQRDSITLPHCRFEPFFPTHDISE